jgi:hypothetical protein
MGIKNDDASDHVCRWHAGPMRYLMNMFVIAVTGAVPNFGDGGQAQDPGFPTATISITLTAVPLQEKSQPAAAPLGALLPAYGSAAVASGPRARPWRNLTSTTDTAAHSISTPASRITLSGRPPSQAW